MITLLEQKVKLLEEKRRSLIDFTVTKGLDSSEEFKDTGIKWIGKIPKHWEVKRISTLYNQTSIRGYEHEENLSVFRDYGVVRRVDYENKNVLSENLSNYKLVKEGDLVLIMDVGAYGFSISHQFCVRPKTAEVLLDKNTPMLIRSRETIEELFENCLMI